MLLPRPHMTFVGLWIEFEALPVASAVERMDLDLMFVEFLETLCVSFTVISKSMVEVDGCLRMVHLV